MSSVVFCLSVFFFMHVTYVKLNLSLVMLICFPEILLGLRVH